MSSYLFKRKIQHTIFITCVDRTPVYATQGKLHPRKEKFSYFDYSCSGCKSQDCRIHGTEIAAFLFRLHLSTTTKPSPSSSLALSRSLLLGPQDGLSGFGPQGFCRAERRQSKLLRSRRIVAHRRVCSMSASPSIER